MIGRGKALVTSSLGQIKNRSRKSEKTIRGLMLPVIIPAEFSTVYLEAHWARKNPVNRPDKLFPVPGCSLQAEKEHNAKEASFPGLWFCAQIRVRCLLCGPRGWGLFPLRNEPGTALWWTGSEFWVRHCTLIWAGRCTLMDRQCWPGHFIHWLDRTGEAAQSIWTNNPMRMERRRRYSKPPCNSVESLEGGEGRGALLSMSLPRAVLMRTLNTDTGRELHTSEIWEMARESDQSLQSYHYVQYPSIVGWLTTA